MADISFTAADIRPLPDFQARQMDAGGTMYAGEAVYISDNDEVTRADADGSLTSRAMGVVVAGNDGGTAFASGDKVDVVYAGPVTGYSSLTAGREVFVSGTAGGMQQDDPGSGTYEFVVGRAINASTIIINPYAADYTAQS